MQILKVTAMSISYYRSMHIENHEFVVASHDHDFDGSQIAHAYSLSYCCCWNSERLLYNTWCNMLWANVHFYSECKAFVILSSSSSPEMKRVWPLTQFHGNMYTSNGLVKPIVIITCDRWRARWESPVPKKLLFVLLATSAHMTLMHCGLTGIILPMIITDITSTIRVRQLM